VQALGDVVVDLLDRGSLLPWSRLDEHGVDDCPVLVKP
jgi:hypothetical protein